MSAIREEFERIYRDNVWGGSGGGAGEGVSGPFAVAASRIIRERGVRSVLDIGCGDGWASALIDLNGADYVGMDIVQSVIEDARKNHPGRRFAVGDALGPEPLPPADLTLMKEITQHLSDDAVAGLLAKILPGTMLLHCGIHGVSNETRDTSGSACRGVMLSLPPFNLPTEPLGIWEYGINRYHAELWSV